jgi:hypothetical protein
MNLPVSFLVTVVNALLLYPPSSYSLPVIKSHSMVKIRIV